MKCNRSLFGTYLSFRYGPYCRFLCQVICSVRSFCKHQKTSRVLNESPLSLWVCEIIIYHYWFGCFRLPAYIIRIFHTALFIIELYILSVAMPVFGLCSNLTTLCSISCSYIYYCVPNVLGIQVCATFVPVQCSTACVLTVDFCRVCTLQN